MTEQTETVELNCDDKKIISFYTFLYSDLNLQFHFILCFIYKSVIFCVAFWFYTRHVLFSDLLFVTFRRLDHNELTSIPDLGRASKIVSLYLWVLLRLFFLQKYLIFFCFLFQRPAAFLNCSLNSLLKSLEDASTSQKKHWLDVR